MDSHRMVELAQTLAAAKNRQDVASAMKVLHHDMVLEAPAFGTTARGTQENQAALTRFFRHFPDYEVTLQGHASDGNALICWGWVQMTLTGDWLGVVPNGKRAQLPVFILLSFQDDLIAREQFFFDLSELCAQSGVSTDAVRHRLFEHGQQAAHRLVRTCSPHAS